MLSLVNYAIGSIGVNPINIKSTKLDKDGKEYQVEKSRYIMTVQPVKAEDMKFRPSGMLYFSHDQIASMASNHGVRTPELFLDMLNKPGNTIAVPYESCKKGDEYVTASGVKAKYTKDWYKDDMLKSIVNLSQFATALQDDVMKSVHTASAAHQIQLNRDEANARKLQTLQRIQAATGIDTNKLIGANN